MKQNDKMKSRIFGRNNLLTNILVSPGGNPEKTSPRPGAHNLLCCCGEEVTLYKHLSENVKTFFARNIGGKIKEEKLLWEN